MSTSSDLSLEQAIRASGEGWVLDLFAPSDGAMNHIRGTLAAIRREAEIRFGENAPEISEDALVALFRQSPRQARGFFQALGGIRTPEMLLMVWRVIQGGEIVDIQLGYHRKERFMAKVFLESPEGEVEQTPYESERIHDFALFRHIGVFETGGRPVFDGFYALNVRDA